MYSLMLLVGLTLGAASARRGHVSCPPRPRPMSPSGSGLIRRSSAMSSSCSATSGRFTVAALRFPSPVVSPDPVNNTVHAEYFRPIAPGPEKITGRRPAVIVLHILGADFALSRYLAARLAERGVAALFVKLPYYGERRPPGEPKRFLSTDIERSIGAMRQGVCDVRRAAAWLASRPEIDPAQARHHRDQPRRNRRFGCGGRRSDSEPGRRSARRGRPRPDPLGNARSRDSIGPSGSSREGRLADLKTLTAPYDPLTYAHRLVGKRLLMIAGNVDEVVPPDCTRALWSAAGRPAAPLVRLRALLGRGLSLARRPDDRRFLRRRPGSLSRQTRATVAELSPISGVTVAGIRPVGVSSDGWRFRREWTRRGSAG